MVLMRLRSILIAVILLLQHPAAADPAYYVSTDGGLVLVDEGPGTSLPSSRIFNGANKLYLKYFFNSILIALRSLLRIRFQRPPS